MRRGVLLFSSTCAIFVLYLVFSVRGLLALLFENGLSNAILPEDVADGTNRTQLIPKIIHQTYKNTSVPKIWQGAQQTCKAMHRDWEYRFWTDEDNEAFIKRSYPWFLDTFRGYKYDIQRADAIRYFILMHYGGVYIDLDNGCNYPLEPLLNVPAWVRKTVPTGISNDVMAAAVGHPFFTRVVHELKSYDRSWPLPYVTVMASTGPLFLSVIWQRWIAEGRNSGDGRVRILFQDDYMGHSTSYFVHHVGNSWHTYDVDVSTLASGDFRQHTGLHQYYSRYSDAAQSHQHSNKEVASTESTIETSASMAPV